MAKSLRSQMVSPLDQFQDPADTERPLDQNDQLRQLLEFFRLQGPRPGMTIDELQGIQEPFRQQNRRFFTG